MQPFTALSSSRSNESISPLLFSSILLNEAPATRLLAARLAAVQEKPAGRQKAWASCGTRRRGANNFTLLSLHARLWVSPPRGCGIILFVVRKSFQSFRYPRISPFSSAFSFFRFSLHTRQHPLQKRESPSLSAIPQRDTRIFQCIDSQPLFNISEF